MAPRCEVTEDLADVHRCWWAEEAAVAATN
jgi:hypothetical protein